MATRQPLFAPAEQNSDAPYNLPRKCSTVVLSPKTARGRTLDHISSEIKLHPHLGSQVSRSVELNLLNSEEDEEGYEPTRTQQASSSNGRTTSILPSMTQQRNPRLNERRRDRNAQLNAAETSPFRNKTHRPRRIAEKPAVGSSRPGKARVGCSPRGGVDPNAAWIPCSSPRAHAPPRPRQIQHEKRRRRAEETLTIGEECLLCRMSGVCGVPRLRLRLGGSSLDLEAGCDCGFGSGRLVGGCWTAGAGAGD